MKHHYKDIRNRINEEPLWWDEYGVPRYDPFTPQQTADIYADEAVLMEVQCQNCKRPFKVSMSRNIIQQPRSLQSFIEEQELHYGDPPNAGCCPAGPTMNSVPIRVLEYWHRKFIEWERDINYEIGILSSWAGDYETGFETHDPTS